MTERDGAVIDPSWLESRYSCGNLVKPGSGAGTLAAGCWLGGTPFICSGLYSLSPSQPFLFPLTCAITLPDSHLYSQTPCIIPGLGVLLPDLPHYSDSATWLTGRDTESPTSSSTKRLHNSSYTEALVYPAMGSFLEESATLQFDHNPLVMYANWMVSGAIR